MNEIVKVLGETEKRQAAASHPDMSAWVSANAGSGKTYVLARRVIRLLLAGTDPSRILCLTYTRAAAANMANQVFGELSAWTRMDDADLTEVIRKLTGTRPGAEMLRRGRRLFARALETPGGLKIQTIHAFCEAVLHQFPLEANIAGHFEMIDARMEATLFAEARRGMLQASAQDPDIDAALDTVLAIGGEFGLDVVLQEVVTKREAVRDFVAQMKAAPEPFAPVFTRFGFRSGTTESDIAGSLWPLDYFTADFADALRTRADAVNKKRALEFAESLKAVIAEPDPVTRLLGLRTVFLRKIKAGRWESRSTNHIAAKDVVKTFPDLVDRFAETAEQIARCVDRLALFRMLEGTRAALLLGDDLVARYERLKAERGLLDFNDLINRTIRLLGRPDVGPWVHYKLDRGIDHILVDEAQDTSPDQWVIVNRLASEFFVGKGSRDDRLRTVFAVGDEKQSIYSFQGAAPEAFDSNRRKFDRMARAAGLDFEPVELFLSFRSTPDILSAVDRVFATERAFKGLYQQPRPTVHESNRGKHSGCVEIWESIGKTDVDEPEDWKLPVDHASAPSVKLAELIAGRIARWIETGEIIEGRGQPLRAGDVMVLVRKRDRFMHALSRGLKNLEIAVAGADRLNLAAHIAVKDLIALGRFVLQPEDDLSLAALMKSPIFDLLEDRLYTLAAGRSEGRSLHAALREAARSDETMLRIERQLSAWRVQADFRPVFEFYADILGAGGVRAKMTSRLGRETGDILDEFLRFALAEEQSGLPGLESFLAALEMSGPDIKREMDQARDEVRIMTIHAAKGLEAPVVFLVDDGSPPFSHLHLPRLLALPPERSEWSGDGFLWRAGRDVANCQSRRLEEVYRVRAEEEYRRLLYVGMTRAEDRLIVCGYHGQKPPQPDTWLDLVRDALLPHAVEIPGPADRPAAHRYRVTDGSAVKEPADRETLHPPVAVAVPTNFLAPVEPAPGLPPPLAPSGAGAAVETDEAAAESVLSEPVEGRPSFAAERGRAVHRLLQVLPDLPDPDRRAAAERYVARAGAKWDEPERRRVVASALSVLRESRFAELFGTGTRAEVSIMGTLRLGGHERSVSGKIDRLAVRDDHVLIVDYKTNRPPARSLADVPFAHLAQMALYRAILKQIYPGKDVRAALLYSETPGLIELPAAELENALARLTTA